jgi:shikimate kinase
MGAGKSAVAREAGTRAGLEVADLDADIEHAEGRPITVLFAERGEAWFRRREGEALGAALRSGAAVIACGGGIVCDPAQRATLASACFPVWLEVAPAEAAARLGIEAAAAARPLLAGADPEARLEALLSERAALYAMVAAARVSTSGRSPAEVAAIVLAAWRDAP